MSKFDPEKHYEQQYLKTKNVFGKKPVSLVKGLLKFVCYGNVIDLGAGEGRNSLYLASKGFDVRAIDISPTAVERIKEKAKKMSLKIEVVKGDIREIRFINNDWDVILSTFVLHHFSKKDGIDFIDKLKNYTKPGAINVIISFTKDGDFYKENPSADRFLPNRGELKNYYSNWEILEYKEWSERVFQKKSDGSPMFNITAGIIARKLQRLINKSVKVPLGMESNHRNKHQSGYVNNLCIRKEER